jgi:hypothetical protein
VGIHPIYWYRCASQTPNRTSRRWFYVVYLILPLSNIYYFPFLSLLYISIMIYPSHSSWPFIIIPELFDLFTRPTCHISNFYNVESSYISFFFHPLMPNISFSYIRRDSSRIEGKLSNFDYTISSLDKLLEVSRIDLFRGLYLP